MVPSVCIHGHFYQPPRENPWLEEIEIQESAAPWHDWNERIAAECYAPNGAARILDEEGRIRSIVSNYSRISFNFGPTLLSWMEKKRPDIYDALLRADRLGMERFSGHGPAIAQVYNHMIMPLASRRDKVTQVLWGLEDFRSRFGRDPEGMWLAETAVDTETLEVMADNGIEFTILAPRQAASARYPGERLWVDVSGERVDVFQPYRCPLPSGKSVSLFFYHGGLAQQVAFGEALRNGSVFAAMLLDAIPDHYFGAPLLSIATDGETFGHHHKYGDMALARCLEDIEKSGRGRLTVYGEYLEKHPPSAEIRIVENSSWSCVHGVERWRSNCGCSATSRPGWSQGWRKPLREGLDGLRDGLSKLYADKSRELFCDPEGARNRYINVLLDRSPERVRTFLIREAGRALSRKEETLAASLLEMEKNLMYMYTSCGWFFDEISGIETLQILAYAARALELGGAIYPEAGLRAPFMEYLAGAASNISEFRDGRRIFEIFIEPLKADLHRAGAHFAVSCLFSGRGRGSCSPERCSFSSYRITKCSLETAEEGEIKFVLGYLSIMSEVTLQEADMFTAALFTGGRNVVCGVAGPALPEDDQGLRDRIESALRRGDSQTLVEFFGHNIYSLRHLFKDEQRKILQSIISGDVEQISGALRLILRDYTSMLSFLAELSMPAPDSFRKVAEVVLNGDLLDALNSPSPDLGSILRRVNDAEKWGISLDMETLRHGARKKLEEIIDRLSLRPDDRDTFAELQSFLSFLQQKAWDVDLWGAQNRFAKLLNRGRSVFGDAEELVAPVGGLLKIRVSEDRSAFSAL